MILFRLFFLWFLTRLELRTRKGADGQAQAMGDYSGSSGTATASAATTLTDGGASWTTDQWRGHVVFVGPNASGVGSNVYGVVLSNTATVLTIDKWYNPASPGGAAGTTPNATGKYVIGPGAAPFYWMSLTENATAPADTDTQLAAELVVGTSAGLERTLATYAHSAATSGASSSYTLTKAYTLTGGTARTIQKVAISNSAVDSASQYMLFETAVTSPPTLATNDQLTVTETVTI